MVVKELYDKINDLISSGKLNWNSQVTVHAYIDDGNAIEWTDEDVMIECYGPFGDGLQINVDTEYTGLKYIE